MTQDEFDDLREHMHESKIDDRMCEGLCIRCARDMSDYEATHVSRSTLGMPAKCPKCAPEQWENLYDK